MNEELSRLFTERCLRVRSLYPDDFNFIEGTYMDIVSYIEYADEAVDSMTTEELNADYEEFLSK